MNYIKVSLSNTDTALNDILVAQLSEIGFEGFEETDNNLYAFITADDYDEAELTTVCKLYDVSFSKEIIEDENWNAKWERSFEPVIVEDFCAIRADFHEPVSSVTHEIVITPKMSFGTGHHATTQLMILFMKSIDCVSKRVLDFGTGTGVLAILAERLGASNITAIDNDEWSYENTLENCTRNNTKNITVHQATLDNEYGNQFDIILANINRNILLQYMTEMYTMLNKGGVLLLSGIMPEDKDVLLNSIEEAGFTNSEVKEMNNWVAIRTNK